jgi:hypothetical protein
VASTTLSETKLRNAAVFVTGTNSKKIGLLARLRRPAGLFSQ